MRLRTLLIALLPAFGFVAQATESALAAEAPVVPLLTLETTELELVQRSAINTHVEFAIPARLNATGVTMRRWSIAQGGRLIDPAGTEIKLGPVANARTTLIASFDLNHLDAAGAYVATIEFAAPPEPPPAPPKGAAAPGAADSAAPASEPKDREQIVQLKLTKPAAELRVSTPLEIERTVRFMEWSVLEPKTITFNEAGGRSWVRINPTTWNIVLRRGNEPAEANRLNVRLPPTVNGWGQADGTVDLDGSISLGTTSGTLTVRAPQLATQTVDFPITVVSHLSRFWLLLTIIFGILGGWYFRDILDKRRARLEAMIPAQEELDVAADLIAKTVDNTFKQRLIEVRRELDVVVHARSGSAQKINDATAKATGKREKITKEIVDLVGKVRGDLENWRRVGSVTDPVPTNVRAALDAFRGVLDRLENRVESGDIYGLDKAVHDELSEQPTKLQGAVKTWVDALLGDVADLNKKPWPETKLPDALAVIAADGKKLRSSADTATGPDAIWTMVVDTGKLLAELRDQVLGRGARDVKATADAVSKALVARDGKLKEQADKIDKAVAQLPDGADAAPDEAEKLAKAVNAVRDAIVAGLTAAWGDLTKDLPGLTDGRFVTALSELEKKPKPGAQQELGDDSHPVPAKPSSAVNRLRDELGRPEELRASASLVWGIELEVPEAFVSEPALVRVHVRIPAGQDQPEVTLRWSENGRFIGATAPGILEWPFLWMQASPILIEVTATDRSGEVRRAGRVVNVQLRHGPKAIATLQDSLELVNRMQKLIAGALIVAAGWVIFSPNFVGTFAELLGAFLWGFSVDIGAAKLGELTESVKGLKPTIPVPKPGP